MKRRMVAFLIAVLAVSITAGFISLQLTQPKTIIVPDNYPTLQAALGNASAGDTVFVKSGTYAAAWLGINKPLKLIGQDPDSTILDGNQKSISPDGRANLYAITVAASNVQISGFTFTNCQMAIVFRGAIQLSGISISGNNIINSHSGISSESQILNCSIKENYFNNNGNAISLSDSINAEICMNEITANTGALGLSASEGALVSYNNIFNNTFGITLQQTSNVTVCKNNITDNAGQRLNEFGYGITFRNCNNSNVYDNNIEKNNNGTNIENYLLVHPDDSGFKVFPAGSDNLVYSNNFIGNVKNANVEYQYWPPESIPELQARYNYTGTINATDSIAWDNGLVGNYWSDYTGEGIYCIDENNVDHYPLNQPVDLSAVSSTDIPDYSRGGDVWLQVTAALAVVGVVLVIVALLGYHKRKHA
ncbi:MAG: right-handed parallel beta-helix repeat-containing protein [Candidatus Bathyarchaeota archaeon]|nr:right-handed parallel beta-helix repeat-containing protein [Candidatus Bathyarchaeota archaeon]